MNAARAVGTWVVGLVLVAAVACDRGSEFPDEAVVRLNVLGTAYLGQQNWAEAEASFRKALASRPDDPLLLTNTAVALIQRGQVEEAEKLLARALEVDAAFPQAHYNLGLIRSRNGDFEGAADHFAAVAAVDPDDLFTQYYLATALARLDRADEAEQAFRKALARDPTHVSTLYGLGRLLLQRGDQDEGTRLVNRSQEIRARSGLDEAVGGQYGEQGPYSLGNDYPGDALPAPPPIAVRFADGAAAAIESDASGVTWTVLQPAPGEPPVVVVGHGAGLSVLSAAAGVRDVVTDLPAGSRIVAVEAGDLDNDGRPDLALLLVGSGEGARPVEPLVLLAEEFPRFVARAPAPPGDASPTASIGDPSGVDLALVDRDHDGDLDLFWCSTAEGRPGECRLATNAGKGSFDNQPSTAHGFSLDPARPGPVSVAFSDTDNDRDVDLLVAEPGGIRLFSNQRDGSFEDVTERVGLGSATRDATALDVADLNKDGFMDLVVATTAGPQWFAGGRAGFAPATPLASDTGGSGGRSLVVLDWDNDGFLDAASGGPRGSLGWHNRGTGRWAVRSDLVPEDAEVLAAFDADGDGDEDLLARRAGRLQLLANEGGNANQWIRLETKGVGDNRFGIGAKVEILAGGLRQKFELTRPLPLHVGLGSRTTVESARYLWPSGVLQDEVDLPAATVTSIAQLDRKGTSCPLLYAWRDGRWQFVTDFLGGCAIGYRHASGALSIPDTDEYVLIEEGLTRDAAGTLRLRVNNQLEEVIWFDQIELVLVDHPTGTRVYPDERLMPAPPWPPFRLFATADVRPVLSARSVESGRDMTDVLRAADRRYADDFALLRPKGYAESHTLELDLGAVPRDARLVLLLDGWIDYADSTANLAAAQAGFDLVPPRLFVADGRGGFVERAGLMGFPAGLPKTMAVELTGIFPTADHRLRLQTSMRIYWDRARVMVGGADTPIEIQRLAPRSAELRFGGFPAETSPDGRKPFGYDPDDVDPRSPWKAHVGSYTAFGDVTGLLARIDDHFVTTRNGDEIELQFPSPAPPRDGYTRTYLLFADGFGKDMDPNSAASDRVEPIPFHGMPTYPYGDGVRPPDRTASGAVPRRVLPSERGWPGALPQAPIE